MIPHHILQPCAVIFIMIMVFQIFFLTFLEAASESYNAYQKDPVVKTHWLKTD